MVLGGSLHGFLLKYLISELYDKILDLGPMSCLLKVVTKIATGVVLSILAFIITTVYGHLLLMIQDCPILEHALGLLHDCVSTPTSILLSTPRKP